MRRPAYTLAAAPLGTSKQPALSPKLVRFGIYQVDVRTSELWKQGRKVKLQEQPCRILAILLEQPGEVATREELRKRLWSDDTFVDFDHSLNTAIRRLREALGDSSENPRFMETLPRHGYRFIAPVEEVAAPEQGKRDDNAANVASEIRPSAVESAPIRTSAIAGESSADMTRRFSLSRKLLLYGVVGSAVLASPVLT